LGGDDRKRTQQRDAQVLLDAIGGGEAAVEVAGEHRHAAAAEQAEQQRQHHVFAHVGIHRRRIGRGRIGDAQPGGADAGQQLLLLDLGLEVVVQLLVGIEIALLGVVGDQVLVQVLHGVAGLPQLLADQVSAVLRLLVLAGDLILDAGDDALHLGIGGGEAVAGGFVLGVLRAAGGLHLIHAGLGGAPGIVGGAQGLAVFAGEQGIGELAGLEQAHLGLVLGGGVLGLQKAGVEGVEGRVLEAALA